jgi:hypothetical protein
MADTTTTREVHDYAPDLLGVRSRVSWSAIFAGALIALSCYLVLTLLFAAIGISMTETGVRGNAIGYGVLIAMILTLIVSLFIGGWVASQLTAGETRQEAVIYGFLTWAAVTGITLFLVASGARAGYFAVVGGSVVADNSAARATSWEELARQSGVSEQQIASAKASMDPARARAEINDPANQERAREAAIAASWTALVGTMLSMAAAVCGALTGRGMAFRLFPVAVARRDGGGPRLVAPIA